MNHFITSFTILLFAFLLSTQVLAQDKVWTGAVDSSWHVAGNWNPSGVPSSSQTVSLRGNKKPYPVVTSNVTVRSVTINQWYSNPGDKLTIRNNATLTITDDFIMNGAGSLDIVNGHVEMTATSGGSNDFNQNSAQSSINITNGSFTAGTASDDVDVEIIGTVNLGNGNFTVFGEFDVSFNSTFNVQNGTVITTGEVLINGTFNGDDGTTTFEDGGDKKFKVEVKSGGVINLGTGNLNLNGKTTVKDNGEVNFGTGNVLVAGDLKAERDGDINIEDATVTITGDAEFKNDGNLTIDSGTLNITGKAELKSGGSFNLNSGSLNIGGDAKFKSGGTVDAGSANITLKGDFEIDQGSTFNSDSSTVIFSGDDEQEVKLDDDITFHNVKIDSGATVITDGGGNTIIIENDLIIDEDANVEIDGNDQLDVQGEVGGSGAENIQSPKPFAVSATAPNLTSVIITFNKAMDETLAETIGNYSIRRKNNSAVVTVSSATLNTAGDSKQVTLVISTILENIQYEITMNNLESTDGGEISTNHKKKFTKAGPLTFFSRKNGTWATNNTWSTVSHSGGAATSNPGNTNGAIIIVGDSDVVTIASSTSITAQTSVEVKSGSKLIIGSGGTLNTGTKNITGLGIFEISVGTLQIGSPNGISSTGATGNIQTSTRSFSSSGSYTYNGTSAQVTGSGLPSTVANLKITNANNVTIDANLEVNGTLTLTNGIFIIESGNNLIANTKSVGSGKLRMKQTISGSRGWRLLSSPLNSDYGDFLDAITTQGYSGSSLGNAPLDSLQPNVLYYLESYSGTGNTDNSRWRAPSNSTTSLTTSRGLYTYIFGNIAADARYNDALPVDLEVEGQENEGPIDLNVSYTAAADSGWNLVGNPYAATIDWDDASNWTKTNIDNTIYAWDPSTNQYKTWNGTTGDLGNGLISPFQGFWIKANSTNPSLIVTENAKTTGGTFVGKANAAIASLPPKFSITVSDDNNRASTHFMFSESANINKDNKDAYRLVPPPGIPSYLDISSVSKQKDRFSINNLPRKFGIPIEIPLFLDVYENGFSVDKPLHFLFENIDNIPDGWSIYLVDMKTKAEIDLLKNDTYLFSFKGNQDKRSPNKELGASPKILTKAPSSNNRFYIRIDSGTDADDLPNEFKLKQNYPNPFNPSTTIEFNLPIQSQVTLDVFDILGRRLETIVSENLSAGEHSYSWNAARYSSGVYIYRLSTTKDVFIKKMTLIK